VKNRLYKTNNDLKKAHLNYGDIMPRGWLDYPFVLQKTITVLSEINPKSKVIDIGCNSGEMMRALQKVNGCETVGIDISESLVRICKRKNLKVCRADAEKIPFKNDIFECVFLGEMIEHTFYPERVISECRRVLIKNGELVGTTLDEEWQLKNNRDYKWEDERLHARPSGLKYIETLIKKFFDNIKVYRIFTPMGNGVPIAWVIFKGRK
jgi:ubiquinone/menaquinone biosynthesis C-methylase UbiE